VSTLPVGTAASDTPTAIVDSPPPEHVAIIMDGNGRWATSRGKPRLEGHRVGTENVRRIIQTFAEHGTRFLTLYAFSTENWARPDEEVNGLIGILQEVIGSEAEELHRRNVRIRHLGRLDRFSPELRKAVLDSLELTKDNTGVTLSVAFDYGGRAEIVDAVRRIVADELTAEEITDDVFRRYLNTADLPDPDLIIRTAGEMRISNFLLWQSAYAEYYVTPVLWPDFDEEQASRALEAYSRRQRRFGGVASQR
jgi:undecaprenyl diphosphate synthase